MAFWMDACFMLSLGSLVLIRKKIDEMKESEAAFLNESHRDGCIHLHGSLANFISLRKQRRLLNHVCCAILGICLGAGSLHLYDHMICAATITLLCWIGLGYASFRHDLTASQDEQAALLSSRSAPKVPRAGCFCCPPGAVHFPSPRRRRTEPPTPRNGGDG